VLEILSFPDDFFFAAETLQYLTQLPPVEFVGLDLEIAQRLAIF